MEFACFFNIVSWHFSKGWKIYETLLKPGWISFENMDHLNHLLLATNKKKNVCWWLCLILWQTSRCLKLGNVCASSVLEGYKLWLADMKDIWGSSESNENIILGYLARFPHFKIGWFRQTKHHGTLIICAIYRFKCLAGRNNRWKMRIFVPPIFGNGLDISSKERQSGHFLQSDLLFYLFSSLSFYQ